MEGNSVKECGICTHEFDEYERCPRSLPCIHCFCTFCIGQLILKNDTKCPFCRQGFEANSAQDLKINTPVLDLIKYIKNMEAKTASDSSKSRSELVDELKKSSIETNKKNLAISEEAVSDLKTAVEKNNDLKMHIGRRLMKLKNDINSKIRELEESYAIKMHYLDEENHRLECEVTKAEEKKRECDRVKILLDDATTNVKVLSAAKETEACDSEVETWITKIQEIISTDKKIYEAIGKSTRNIENKMSSLTEILTQPGKEVDIAEELAAIKLQDENQGQITPEILQRMTTTTKCLVSLEGIYAVKQHEGRRKCARISITENKVCLHALREEQLPLNVCTIEHDDVMRLVNPSSRLTFLEFGDEKSTLGRVYVRLSLNTKRAQNFSVLCTGEMGPTYLGTSILQVQKIRDHEFVFCGGYMVKKLRIFKALIPGSGSEGGGVLGRPLLLGSVCGLGKPEDENADTRASKFVIVTGCKTESTNPSVFGMVESGLDILQEIISLYPSLDEVRITDCGTVLNE